MPRVPTLEDGEWFRPRMRAWRQLCCGCGLAHDWQFRVVDGKVWARISRNERSTAAARRTLKKKVLIIE
jgi:hypothetical protein